MTVRFATSIFIAGFILRQFDVLFQKLEGPPLAQILGGRHDGNLPKGFGGTQSEFYAGAAKKPLIGLADRTAPPHKLLGAGGPVCQNGPTR